jgi:drug/metabolite transporter (DMT)-like permease
MVFYVNRLPGANATQASYLGCMLHILLLPALLNDPNFSLADPKVNLVVLLMGVLQMGLAYVLFAKGIASTPAVSASIIAMIEPVLNPLWVFLFLGEMPGRLALVGAAIVLIATTSYNIITSKQLEEKGHTAEA